jgi:hypothetical protein
VCVFITAVPITKAVRVWGGKVEDMCYERRRAEACGLREEPGTLTKGGALFSLVPLVWESNPKLQGGWCKPNHQPNGGCCVCVYYCSTYYEGVREGGG